MTTAATLFPAFTPEVQQFIDSIDSIPWLIPQGEPDPSWDVTSGQCSSWHRCSGALKAAKAGNGFARAEEAFRAAKTALYPDRYDPNHPACAAGSSWSVTRSIAKNRCWETLADRMVPGSREVMGRQQAINTAYLAGMHFGLYAGLLALGDAIDPTHLDYLRPHIEAWRAGYGVEGESGGTLFVFSRVGGLIPSSVTYSHTGWNSR